MSRLIFGTLPFDRASIPAALSDLRTWPTVDTQALKAERRAVYLKRTEAVELFVREPSLSLTQISHRTGIDRKSIVRLFKRCAEPHGDGQLCGFRALVPFNRLKAYARRVPVPLHEATSNSAGAFSQLLERYPALDAWLDRAARNRARLAQGKREVRQDLRRIHKNFLGRCRELGITASQYPFNRERLALRSLAAHLKRRTHQSFATAAADAGAPHTRRAWSEDLTRVKAPITRPFEAVEFDGHKIDVRLTVKVIDPFGFDVLFELGRIWILVIIDVATRAILGYGLALGKEYTSEDVIEALNAALTPRRARELMIPGLSYRADGGMPSAVIPETAYACWDWFRCDNAKAHLAEHTLGRLTDIVGCWPDLGPPGEPNERAFVERFFSLLTSHFAHRLTGTTGSQPHDIRRVLGDPGNNASLLLRLDELEELIDVMICDYNGEAHDGLGGRTPLEALRYLLDRGDAEFRTLALAHRDGVLLRDARTVIVRGQPKTGVRPYINLSGARYSSDLLSGNAALIGKRLRIYFDMKDLRRVRAFFENGEELGILMAGRPWCFTAHSLRTRKEILKLRARGKLRYRDGDDAVEAYVKYKRTEATRKNQAVRELAKLTHPSAARPGSPAPPPGPGPEGRSRAERILTLDARAARPIEVPAEPDPIAADTPTLEPPVAPRVKALRTRKAIIF